MSESGARIIDTKEFVQKLENTDRIEKIKTTRKLNKIADAELAKEESFQNKNTNPFMNLKIPKRGLGKKPRGRKKPVIDFEKFTVNQYTYEEFSRSVNTVIPNVINHLSFKDPKFLDKLKKSKDIKHFANEEILFPITNDYLGFASAILGAGIEYYVENKMGVESLPERKKKPDQVELPEPSEPSRFQLLMNKFLPPVEKISSNNITNNESIVLPEERNDSSGNQ